MKIKVPVQVNDLIKSYIELKELPKSDLPVYKITYYSTWSVKQSAQKLSKGLILLDYSMFDKEIAQLVESSQQTIAQIYIKYHAFELGEKFYIADEHLNISSVRLYLSQRPFIDISLSLRTYGIYWNVIDK